MKKQLFINFLSTICNDSHLFECIMNGYNVCFESSISLNQIYGSKYDIDDSEVIHQFIDNNDDWDIQFPIKTFTVNELIELEIPQSNMSVIDAYKKYATKEQKSIVNYYIEHKDELHRYPVIFAGKTLLDGHHRVIAAILSNINIEGIDVYGDNVQLESINSWDPNVSPITPYSNPVGEPMGSYKNIFKQLPSHIGAVGTGGDMGGASYKYEPSLANTSRNINDETKTQWDDAPHFPKFVKKSDQTVKRFIKKANEHIPMGVHQNPDQIGYYTNMTTLGNFDMDIYKQGSPIPSPG